MPRWFSDRKRSTGTSQRWPRSRYSCGNAIVDRLEPGWELSDQIGITECRDRTVGRCIRPATATSREGEHDRHAGLDVDVSGLVEHRILEAPMRLDAPLEHEPASVLVFVAHRDLHDCLTVRQASNVDALGRHPRTISGSRSTIAKSSGSHASAQPRSERIVGARSLPAAVSRYGSGRLPPPSREMSPSSSSFRSLSARTDREM